MALGTNYKRNKDREDKAVEARIQRAKDMAKELGGNLGLASSVVLGKITIEQAKREAVK